MQLLKDSDAVRHIYIYIYIYIYVISWLRVNQSKINHQVKLYSSLPGTRIDMFYSQYYLQQLHTCCIATEALG